MTSEHLSVKLHALEQLYKIILIGQSAPTSFEVLVVTLPVVDRYYDDFVDHPKVRPVPFKKKILHNLRHLRKVALTRVRRQEEKPLL